MYRYACTGTHATVTYFEAGITDLCVQTTSFVRMAREKRFCCLLYTQDEPGKKKIIGTSRKYHEPTEYDDGYESKQTNKQQLQVHYYYCFAQRDTADGDVSSILQRTLGCFIFPLFGLE